MSFCKSCRAEVRWCLTANGKRSPIDAEPHQQGNLYLVGRGSCVVAISTQSELGAAIAEDFPEKLRYRSHFVTCPNAGRHRQ